MSDVKLLPCPFCGGKAHVERRGSARQSTIYECDSCGCRLETGEEFNIGSRWNARACIEADRKPLQAEIKKLREDLAYVERVVNHHGQKPGRKPTVILSMVQHYPAIKEITRGYSDGVMPATPDPYTHPAPDGVARLVEAARSVVNACSEHYGNGMGLHLALTGKRGLGEKLDAALAPFAATQQEADHD